MCARGFCVLHNKVSLSERQARRWGNGQKRDFPLKGESVNTQSKEQQRVKQWALVFQNSTHPIIYTALTGAILKSVTGGKLCLKNVLLPVSRLPPRVRVINDLWPYCGGGG